MKHSPEWLERRREERQAKEKGQELWEANRQYCECGHPIDNHSLGDFGPEKCFVEGCDCHSWRRVPTKAEIDALKASKEQGREKT